MENAKPFSRPHFKNRHHYIKGFKELSQKFRHMFNKKNQEKEIKNIFNPSQSHEYKGKVGEKLNFEHRTLKLMRNLARRRGYKSRKIINEPSNEYSGTIKKEKYSINEISKEEIKNTLLYWTKERIEKAVPLENILPENFFKKIPKINLPKDEIKADTEFVRPETLYQEHPYKTIGKALFRFQGRDAFCSASSSGNNAVITAGHCLWMEGNFHTNFIFVPQYNDGNATAGRYLAKKLIIFEEWKETNFARDVGFAIVEKFNGRTLEQAVGFMEAGTCEVNENFRAFGYPGPDYGGKKLVRTIGSIQRRFPLSPWEPAPVGIRSKMGPGSSGGPWIMKWKGNGNDKNNTTNIVCSVNSIGIRFTYYVFGPYFDQKVLEMRKEAIRME